MTITKPTVKPVVVKKKHVQSFPKQAETPWKEVKNSLAKAVVAKGELNQINPNPVDQTTIDRIADMI